MSKKLDFRLKLLVYQKQIELSFFQNVAKTTERSFSLLYSIGHQVQGHLHFDKSIVPWIESLITTQCVLFCPYVGVFAILKNKKFGFLGGFHRTFATGVACRQGTLNPPDTWSRPFGTCIICSTCWDQSFSELVVILPDYALRISLGTFSILLSIANPV